MTTTEATSDSSEAIDQIMNADHHWKWVPSAIIELLEYRQKDVENLKGIDDFYVNEDLSDVIDQLDSYQKEMELLNETNKRLHEEFDGIPPRHLSKRLYVQECDITSQCEGRVYSSFEDMFYRLGLGH